MDESVCEDSVWSFGGVAFCFGKYNGCMLISCSKPLQSYYSINILVTHLEVFICPAECGQAQAAQKIKEM